METYNDIDLDEEHRKLNSALGNSYKKKSFYNSRADEIKLIETRRNIVNYINDIKKLEQQLRLMIETNNLTEIEDLLNMIKFDINKIDEDLNVIDGRMSYIMNDGSRKDKFEDLWRFKKYVLNYLMHLEKFNKELVSEKVQLYRRLNNDKDGFIQGGLIHKMKNNLKRKKTNKKRNINKKSVLKKSQKQRGGICYGKGVGSNNYDPNFSIYNTRELQLFPYNPIK